MILLDANVLIYAQRKDAVKHPQYRDWLEDLLNSQGSFGVNDNTLSTVIRITTNPKIFKDPTSLKDIFLFIEQVRRCPNCLMVNPGSRHWEIFTSLVKSLKLTGNAIPDAFLAALALEWGYDLVTTDQGFSHFPALKCRHPLVA